MTERKENKMGVMNENKLLLSMSFPMMISMLVQALYNIVDSIFVAKVSEAALTAVSLAFPVQMLMISVAIGTGVGINALLSKSLGEKNYERADSVALHGIVLALISFVVFALIGASCSSFFFSSQTSDPVIYAYGRDYMFINLVLSFGLFLQITFERILQSTGRTMYTMYSQATGAIVNIILDPILIFGLFGLPRMEVAGAALATVIGQISGAVLGYIFNVRKNHDVRFHFKLFRFDWKIVSMIYAVGIPSIIMQSVGSVMMFGMNRILMGFTSTAAAVFGVYFKLQSFVFMPIFGMTNAMVPILAYNYGAHKSSRIKKTIRLTMAYVFLMALLGFILFQVFPRQLLVIFDASEHMMNIGVVALRTISFSFLLAGFAIVSSSVFQALGHGVLSLIISVMRQLVVLLPVAYLFSRIAGLDQIWLSYPIAELMSFALSMVFLRHIYKKQIDKL